MATQRHELKTWPEPFQAMLDGKKTFEVREDDRGYQVGDTLVLQEWVSRPPYGGSYTYRVATYVVTYILHGGRFGLPPDLCVMSVVPKESANA